MNQAQFLLGTALLALASCGGGGGGGDAAPQSAVSAGANRTVGPLTRTTLVATSALSVDDWSWDQVAGPDVALVELSDGAVRFDAPAFPTEIELEVEARGASGELLGSDRAVVTVEGSAAPFTVQTLATLDIGGGGERRATGVALHGATARLFVVDEAQERVVVYDVQNPSSPSFAGVVTGPPVIPGYTPGRPLAVGAGDEGVVAITWSDAEDDFPGRLQLVDPVTLAELRTFSTTGSRPVDVDVTPDGRVIAIACGGDRTVTTQGDGRGYLTIVQVPAGGVHSILPHEDVAPIPFSAFDGREAELAAAGVRFLGPMAPDASIDLAPRAVAVSEDGARAWAVCAENNCIVTVDVGTQLAVGVRALGARPNGSAARGAALDGARRTWTDAPSLVQTPAGDPIPAGGFQGLLDAQETADGLRLRVVSGSGPTLRPVDLDGDGELELPFVAPERALGVHRITVGPGGEVVAVERTTEFTGPASGPTSGPVTGLPESYPSAPGLAGHDEIAIGLDGVPRTAPGLGARFAGATLGMAGEVWCADARRASLWRFDGSGALVERFVPAGSPAALGTPSLPAAFARRRVRLASERGLRFGGFGGIAFDPARGSVLAVTRLPLDTPDTEDDAVSRSSRILRLVEVDATSGALLGEYAVVTSGVDHAAEGLAIGPASEPFLGAPVLLEVGPGAGGLRALFRLDLEGATNLAALPPADYASIDAVLESTDPGALASLTPPIVPVARALALDLGAAAAGEARPSALGFAGERLVVVHDDGRLGASDARFAPGTGALVQPRPIRAGALLEGRARGHVFDTAVDGDGPAATDFVPAIALDQPTGAVSFGAGTEARVLLANGGAPRVLLDVVGSIGFDERVAAEDLVLDTQVFPNADQWRPVPFGGRLAVSLIDADRGGDGLADRLAVFGSRSVSMVDADGAWLWSSGAPLVEWARALRPERVDGASEGSGVQPRAVARVEIGGRPCAVTALGGAGLVAVHDLGTARAPRLVALGSTVLRPSSIAGARIGGTAIVAVADALAGRVVLQRVSD